MSRVENLGHFSQSQGSLTRVLDSRFADMMRRILPESAKFRIREFVRGQRAKFPQAEPITVTLAGFEANFWIRNHNDWYRIGIKDFEGEYGLEIIGTLASMDKPNFLDVGSAQGYYSILAAKTGSQVVAIDPDPVSQHSLGENLRINPDVKDRVRSLGIALGNQSGEVTLHIDRAGIYAPSLRKTVRGLRSSIQVPVDTLDVLIFEGKILVPDVIKIDVEGAEGLVIDGMQKTLLSYARPKHLFVELHGKYLPLFGTNADGVWGAIVSNNYNLENCWQRRGGILCHFTSC